MIDEDGAIVEPIAFIPIAERFGMMRAIDGIYRRARSAL
jgi:EAL domain-containing protein (putative c-di-GMP-specific phosphodiesterase class I)